MSERKRYRQRWTPGAIVKIDLGDSTFGYGQVLEPPQVAFYNCNTTGDPTPDIQDIIKKDVIFKISVMKYCVTQDWQIIGKILLDQELNQWPDKYIHDSLREKIFIYKQHSFPQESTWEECKNLECVAVWGSIEVEQRLRDHFAGRPCFFVESDKPEWKFIPIQEFYKQYGYDYNANKRSNC